MRDARPASARWLPLVVALVTYGMAEGISAIAHYAVVAPLVGTWFMPIPVTLDSTAVAFISSRIPDSASYYQIDPMLGWTLRPGGQWAPLHRANAQGLRGSFVYDTIPRSDRVRIAAFGDSFVYGDDVANADAWAAQMEARDTTLEVLNFGVGAYGLDQALLRYRRDGVAFAPQIVLIGVLAENVSRGVNTWRPFYAWDLEFGFTGKPRFALSDTGLVLHPNPLPNGPESLLRNPDSTIEVLGIHDDYFQHRERPGAEDFSPTVRLFKIGLRLWRMRADRLDPGGVLRAASPRVQLAIATLRRFATEVRDNGGLPVIVLFEEARQIAMIRGGAAHPLGVVRDSLLRDGVRVIDLEGAFPRCDPACLKRLAPYHYSAEGYRIVAGHLREQLAPDIAAVWAQRNPDSSAIQGGARGGRERASASY